MKIKGFEWSLQGRIIAALVNRLGGNVTLSDLELGTPEGLLIDPSTPPGILKIEASVIDKHNEVAPYPFEPNDVKQALL